MSSPRLPDGRRRDPRVAFAVSLLVVVAAVPTLVGFAPAVGLPDGANRGGPSPTVAPLEGVTDVASVGGVTGVVSVGGVTGVAPVAPATDLAPAAAPSSLGRLDEPVARCELSRTTIAPGESVTLDASASENAASYRWDKFGDGSFGPYEVSETRTFTYEDPGTYEPRVGVLSADDATDTATCGTLTVESDDEPPEARIDWDARTVAPGETVAFGSTSTDSDGSVVAQEWRVDGDPVGDRVDLTYTFEEPGDHTVELTVTDDDGASDTARVTVTVEAENEGPTAEFTYSPTEPVVDEAVSFESGSSDPDGEIASHEWRVDGSVVGEGPTLEYAFPGPGDYTVALNVTDDDGASDVARRTVSVARENRPPDLSLSYSPRNPAPGETVSFEAEAQDGDGDVVEYRWRVDGEPVGDGPALEYEFPAPGDYTVSLTATDDDGASTTVNATVAVGEADNRPPSVELSHSPERPAPDEEVALVAEASDPDGDVVEYRWSIDGERLGATGPELTRAFPGPGDYTVEVTVTDDDGANATATTTVTVAEEENRGPSVDLSYSPTRPEPDRTVEFVAEATDPDGEVTAYEWSVDGETVSGAADPEFSRAFPAPGEYSVAVTVTDDDGATATAEVTVTVRRPDTTETPTTTAGTPETPTGEVTVTAGWAHAPLVPDAGETVSLFASGPADPRITYRWDLDGDDEFEAEGPVVSHAFPGPGDYTVTLRAVGPDGETDSRTATVQVGERREGTRESGASDGPSVWMSPLSPRPGERVRLAADPAADPGSVGTYRWDLDGDGEFEKEGRVVTHAFPGPGDYTVRVETVRSDGEVNASSGTVSASGEPTVPERNGPSVWISPLNPTPGERVLLTAQPSVPSEEVAAYRWDLDGDGEPDAEGRSVSHTFPETGAVDVSLTVERTDGSTATAAGTVPVGNATVETDPGTTAGTTAGDPGTDTSDGTTNTGDTGPQGTTPGDDGPADGLGLPGFGVGPALVAVAAAAFLIAGRAGQGDDGTGGDRP